MKIIVVGLGSMGKRRIRLLQKRADIDLIVGIDSNPDRRKEAKSLYSIKTAESISYAVSIYKPDCAFICVSPLSHSAIIKECLENNLHVFTEINLVSDGYEENIRLSQERNKVLFLSSTFLYREEVKYIRSRVKQEMEKVNYIYHIGQYLPDWHPWENYNNFFVGNKRTNGCREIMAIEMPWLIETFGEIDSFYSTHGKMSSLAVDYDDNYMIQLCHKNGNRGCLIIDVVSRKAVRNFEVYSENLHIFWDGTPSGLKEYKLGSKQTDTVSLYKNVEHTDGYQATVIENAYEDEIDEFLSVIKDKKKPIYGFEKDLITLGWLDRIEGIS